MRISYSDEEIFQGQFELWQANCRRSLRGRDGQRTLREMEAALVALPSKRLVRNAVACDGDVCAVGAFLLMRKVQGGTTLEHAQAELEAEMGLSDEQDTIDTEQLGIEAGMPRLVAWKLVEMNDIELDYRWDAEHRRRVEITPEERYERLLGWVRQQIADTSRA